MCRTSLGQRPLALVLALLVLLLPGCLSFLTDRLQAPFAEAARKLRQAIREARRAAAGQDAAGLLTSHQEDTFHLEEVAYGCLADVTDLYGAPILGGVLIHPELPAWGPSFRRRQAGRDREILQILRPAGSDSFLKMLEAAQEEMPLLPARGRAEAPAAATVPARAAFRLRFSRRIDPASAGAAGIQALGGPRGDTPIALRWQVWNRAGEDKGYLLVSAASSPPVWSGAELLLRLPAAEGGATAPFHGLRDLTQQPLTRRPGEPGERAAGGRLFIVRAARPAGLGERSPGPGRK